jgi:hypothetical protein
MPTVYIFGDAEVEEYGRIEGNILYIHKKKYKILSGQIESIECVLIESAYM